MMALSLNCMNLATSAILEIRALLAGVRDQSCFRHQIESRGTTPLPSSLYEAEAVWVVNNGSGCIYVYQINSCARSLCTSCRAREPGMASPGAAPFIPREPSSPMH